MIGRYVTGMDRFNKYDFQPLDNPETDTVETMVLRLSKYFADNPNVLGVELFTTDVDGNKSWVGYVRNPSMKSLFNDVHQAINSHETRTKPRTVEIRPKP